MAVLSAEVRRLAPLFALSLTLRICLAREPSTLIPPQPAGASCFLLGFCTALCSSASRSMASFGPLQILRLALARVVNRDTRLIRRITSFRPTRCPGAHGGCEV
jgi:hypothetical protein